MVNKPKSIGTAAETAVARAARTRGFSHADRLTLTGRHDRGDIGLCPGIILEVKAGQAARTASDNQIATWLRETERERVNAHAAIAILVTVRPGIGPANAHRWWAHMTTGTLIDLIWGTRTGDAFQPDTITSTVPVRMTLDAALELLRANGYGDPFNHPLYDNALDDQPGMCSHCRYVHSPRVSCASVWQRPDTIDPPRNLPGEGRAHEAAALSVAAQGGAA